MRIFDYQRSVWKWVNECFGRQISTDTKERCCRFLEESLELVQSLDVTKEEAQELLNYVYSRPKGTPNQEVGGVMVTLAALNSAVGIDMEAAATGELTRVNSHEIIAKIRKKHYSKPENIKSVLPGLSEEEIEKEFPPLMPKRVKPTNDQICDPGDTMMI